MELKNQQSKLKIQNVVQSFNTTKELVDDMSKINNHAVKLIKEIEMILLNLRIQASHLNAPEIDVIGESLERSIKVIKDEMQKQSETQENKQEEYKTVCDYFSHIEENISKTLKN